MINKVSQLLFIISNCLFQMLVSFFMVSFAVDLDPIFMIASVYLLVMSLAVNIVCCFVAFKYRFNALILQTASLIAAVFVTVVWGYRDYRSMYLNIRQMLFDKNYLLVELYILLFIVTTLVVAVISIISKNTGKGGKRLGIAVISVITVISILSVCFTPVTYKIAKMRYEKNDFDLAYGLFQVVDYYKDSQTYIDAMNEKDKWISFNNISLYKSVYLGSIEQDGNTENGAEPIEWICIKKKLGSAMLISKYVLDIHRFSETNENITWNDSEIRKYLNKEFLNDNFTPEERKKIKLSSLENKANYKWLENVDSPKTKDYIFLLNEKEYYKFLPSLLNEPIPTEYCKDKFESKTNYNYMLRATSIDEHGVLVETSFDSFDHIDRTNEYLGIRPCIWVSMD